MEKVNSRMLFRTVEEKVQSVKPFPHESMRTWVGSPALKTNNKNESDWWPELIITVGGRQKAQDPYSSLTIGSG